MSLCEAEEHELKTGLCILYFGRDSAFGMGLVAADPIYLKVFRLFRGRYTQTAYMQKVIPRQLD